MSRDWTGNQHSVFTCLGARNEAKEERAQHDFYATEPKAAELLCEIEALDEKIWEPACGEGHLGKVFEAHGHKVTATDLIDRGYGRGGVDFLQCNESFDGDIVTNPPYKYAQEFVEKALGLVTDGHKVCMFLKVQFLEGKNRRKMYDKTPPPHGVDIFKPFAMRQKRSVFRLSNRLRLVYMGEGLQRGHRAPMV